MLGTRCMPQERGFPVGVGEVNAWRSLGYTANPPQVNKALERLCCLLFLLPRVSLPTLPAGWTKPRTLLPGGGLLSQQLPETPPGHRARRMRAGGDCVLERSELCLGLRADPATAAASWGSLSGSRAPPGRAPPATSNCLQPTPVRTDPGRARCDPRGHASIWESHGPPQPSGSHRSGESIEGTRTGDAPG